MNALEEEIARQAFDELSSLRETVRVMEDLDARMRLASLGVRLAEAAMPRIVEHRHVGSPGGQEAFAAFRRRYILGLLRDAAGHGGCKMLRRMMGIVSVWDITSIEDLDRRAQAERLAIKIGSRWVLERSRIEGVDDLVGIVLDETEGVDA